MYASFITKEYLWSSLITFVTAFGIAVLPLLGAAPISKAALFAIFTVGARAGVRALLNLAASKGTTVSSTPTK